MFRIFFICGRRAREKILGRRTKIACRETCPPAGTSREASSLASRGTKVLVVKLVRAFGGCLGTKRRRRTWQNCEKPRGAVSRRRSVGLRIGKPPWLKTMEPPAESIGRRRRTRGTETSQYLQERKSNETPLVVASERGPAQTIPVQACRRCRYRVVGPSREHGSALDGPCEGSRTTWEGRPERVTAP